jgi:putative resolvase
VNLSERAKEQGVHPHTTYRSFREGVLAVPATRVGPRTILVNVGVGLYARVSSHEQKSDLERQVVRTDGTPNPAG